MKHKRLSLNNFSFFIKSKRSKTGLILALIIFIGFLWRLIGFNWDQGQHLHPDERFLTMVSSTITFPQTIKDYFNTDNSAFNPNNNGFDFFVYGTFPLLVVKILANLFNLGSYDQIYLVGRFLSALFDTFTIFLIFKISQKIFKNTQPALFSAFLYSICLFPIQQSHFFTVDAITVFLFTLSLFLLLSQKISFSGFVFGIALASKTSIGIVLPFIFLFIIFQNKKFLSNFWKCFLFGLFLFFSFRIFQPYAFNGLIGLSPNFIDGVHQAHQMITGEINYPPNIQWAKTVPFIHPIVNLFFIGLGPITFLFVFWSILKFFSLKKNLKNRQSLFILLIILTVFIYHSLLLAKYMRYFYPIYPLLMVFGGFAVEFIRPKILKIFLVIDLLVTLAFVNIYLFPHSRYRASEWICQNISLDSVLSSELWDDSLPLNTPSCQNFYPHQELSLYDPESDKKWQIINQKLASINYLIFSSNRFWGSIPKSADKYPVTVSFYGHLFDGQTNFKLIKRFYSYPGFYLPWLKKCILVGPSNYPYQDLNHHFFEIDLDCPYPGLYFKDDLTEESFTVYDHPQILIFQHQ